MSGRSATVHTALAAPVTGANALAIDVPVAPAVPIPLADQISFMDES